MKKNKSIWLIVAAALGALFAVQAIQTMRYNRKTADFPDDSAVGQGKPVLVQISSAGCPPCRRMIPVLTDLADQYAEYFTAALVCLDKQPGAQKKYNVQAVPTQIFYDGRGEELYRHSGALTAGQILDRWRQLGVEIP